MNVVFDDEAEQEMLEAAAFYREVSPELGDAFLDAVDVAVYEILTRPLFCRRIRGRFRRCLLPRFPYAIIYAPGESVIYIAAVMHLKRKPNYWARRSRRRTE
jgi:hypothetical protein